MSELKLCPFCNGVVHAAKNAPLGKVILYFLCDSCGATASFRVSQTSTEELWNARAAEAVVVLPTRFTGRCLDSYKEGYNDAVDSVVMRNPGVTFRTEGGESRHQMEAPSSELDE